MSEVPTLFSLFLVLFLALGAIFTFIGCFGLMFLKNFYERLHMPTLATSGGVSSMTCASLLASFFSDNGPTAHGLIIAFFILITTPVTLMMLAQAALQRESTKDWRELPERTISDKPEKIDQSM